MTLAVGMASALIDARRQSVFGLLGFLDCRVRCWSAAAAFAVEGFAAAIALDVLCVPGMALMLEVKVLCGPWVWAPRAEGNCVAVRRGGEEAGGQARS